MSLTELEDTQGGKIRRQYYMKLQGGLKPPVGYTKGIACLTSGIHCK